MRTVFVLPVLLAACTDDGSTPSPLVANGHLDPWQMMAPLPVARANHCIASLDNTVFVIGGNTKVGADFVKTDDIHAGTVALDGTVTWRLVGKTPSPVTECSATMVPTADGGLLYILDGLYDNEAHARQVFTAKYHASSDMLEAPAPFATLPQIAISSEAVQRGSSLLLMDTVLPNEGDKTVTLRAPLTQPTPTWSTDDWGIGFRAQAQYAFTDRFAYTIGGYKGDVGNPVTADVFVAPIDTKTGAIGAATPVTPLPKPISFGEAIAVDDFIFVVGGRAQVFGAPGTTDVFTARVQSDGTLSAWTIVNTLPMARTNHELALAGDFLVITGGAVNGPGDTTVMTTRVRFEPVID